MPYLSPQQIAENNIWNFLKYFQIQMDPLMLTLRTNATFEEVIMYMNEYNFYQASMARNFLCNQTTSHNFPPGHYM